MKRALVLSLTSVGFIGSIQAATVIADRIVVTNSILNNGPQVTTHWAEIQVFQLTIGTNVAASSNGGVATAASSGYGSVPSDANDGNTDGNFNNGSVWHDADPGLGANPDVFTITFSQAFSVDSFNIWGRDQNVNRDNNFLVEFYNGAQLVGSNPNMRVDDTSFNTGVTPITAVPEPTSLVMGLLSLGVLGRLRRRR